MPNEQLKPASYRDLLVWQKAMALMVMVYEETAHWPREELYGAVRQVRDAALSVPQNVAEGHGRGSARAYLYFVNIAYGSLMELETVVLAAGMLKFGRLSAHESILAASAEVGKMLNGLRNSLQRRLGRPIDEADASLP